MIARNLLAILLGAGNALLGGAAWAQTPLPPVAHFLAPATTTADAPTADGARPGDATGAAAGAENDDALQQPPSDFLAVAMQPRELSEEDVTRGFGTIGRPGIGTVPPATGQAAPSAGPAYLSSEEDISRGFGTIGQPIRPSVRSAAGFGTIRQYKPNMMPLNRKVGWNFQDGIYARSDDGYFSFFFHNLTQFDYRGFNPTGDPLHDSFVVARQRWYFMGNVSPFASYYTTINDSYGTLSMLDAFIDMNLGVIDADKFQIRIGQMKTPYSYEWIRMSANTLIAPERSVFIDNFGTNRQDGVMAHGQLIQDSIEYAVGLFNGPRHSSQDYNNSKDLFTYLDTKPFLLTDFTALRELHLGASFNYGVQHNPAVPNELVTASNLSTGTAVNSVSPVFYTFDPRVFESGPRMQWSTDVVWYYKSLTLLAACQGGYQTYETATAAIPSNFVGVVGTNPTRVILSGWNATASYFFTGEETTRRNLPPVPRNEYKGKLRWSEMGALEGYARFANLAMSDNSLALASATMASSNRANVTDIGFNWYPNPYLKYTLDWQYAAYPTPVYIAPGRVTTFNNVFWFRGQLFF